jgi:hypothetical protein
MTEPTSTPPPATPIPAAPSKGGSGGKVLMIAVGVVVAVVVALGARQLLGAVLGDNLDDYREGACLDSLAMSSTAERTSVPNVVDCNDPAAEARILEVNEGGRFAHANVLCPTVAVSAVELQKRDGGTILLCLGLA